MTLATIAAGCISVLNKRGFRMAQTPPAAVDAIEYAAKDWFEQPITGNLPKKDTGLTRQQFDEIVLECGVFFAKHGFEDVHYNESLNVVGEAVIKILDMMGYETESRVNAWRAGPPQWGGYKLSETLYRACGLSEERVTRIRTWFAKERPEHYEAT